MLPLDCDALRMGFWAAVFKACGVHGEPNDKLRGHLVTAARAMKLCFTLCKSPEETERRKWGYSTVSQILAENTVLRGWKRIVGVVEVKFRLASWSMGNSDEQVTYLNSRHFSRAATNVFAILFVLAN